MRISISYAGIVSSVRNQLSILAKRSVSRDGKGNYDMVSLSGIEGGELEDFVSQGVSSCVSEMTECVDVVEYSPTGVELEVNPMRGFTNKVGNDGFEDSFAEAFRGYVVTHVLYEYLSLVQSPVAQKFMTDLALKLRTLKGLVFVKGEPSVSKDYGDIAGSLVDVS